MEAPTHDDVEPPAREDHETSWSANLEQPRHADDPAVVVAEAIDAVDHTASGTHVNLVTHEAHGHPREYLYDVLAEQCDADLDVEYVDQCGCGGHVVRVHVR